MSKSIEKQIIDISNNILTILLKYKEDHPEFTFSLRQRDSPQSKDKRLEKGYWFQGSNYIYVPLFRKGDNARKIKTIGFVVGFNKDKDPHNNFIEISFKSGSSDKEQAFHHELAAFFGVKLNKENFGYYFFKTNDFEENIKFYLGEFREKALELLKKYSITDRFVVSESQFIRNLNRIQEIKQGVIIQSSLEVPKNKKDFKKKFDTTNLPLNKILYGPPGTGKTYRLQKDYYKCFEIENKTVSHEEFEINIIHKMSWWQVLVLVLLENNELTVPEIKKHRFIDYKLKVSNSKSLSQTVWGQLSAHAIEDSQTVQYGRRSEPLIFDKSMESVWKIVDEKKELIDELNEIYQSIKDYKEVKVTSKNYKFITFHQSYSYEDFIEGIKPVINIESESDLSQVNYTVDKGIFYECCNEAAKLAGFLSLQDSIENYSIQDRMAKFLNASPYCLFIDEINRANISQIFGELITVIESTKRLGHDEIIVELPYSKSKFGVPPNLYIIGTMNTADRSVEALDTALRRRFCFEEILPDINLLTPSAIYCRLLWEYEHVAWEDAEFIEKEGELFTLLNVPEQWLEQRQEIWKKMKADNDKTRNDYFSHFICSGLNLKFLLKIINDRIEVMLDRDHAIGHSYFISVYSYEDLKNVFKKNIIPLLQEYFYNDYEKIGWIIGEGFFNESIINQKKLFTSFYNRPKPEFEMGYHLVDLEQIDIKKAFQRLAGIYVESK